MKISISIPKKKESSQHLVGISSRISAEYLLRIIPNY